VKILIFEYICGGGFSATTLPPALAQEGLLMLKALTDDLLENHQLVLLMDWRVSDSFDARVQRIIIHSKTALLKTFKKALLDVEAVWLIAPETEGILNKYTQLVQSSTKKLLTSPSCAVQKTADKWETFQQLSLHNITTINTVLVNRNTLFFSEKSVLKKRDGVGGEACFLINSQHQLTARIAPLENPNDYLLQPFMEGKNLSLSALFKFGNAQLICLNQQKITITQHGFKLDGCDVNVKIASFQFQLLLNKIANAFPTLWGYVGIDLIQQSQKLYVVEINPRLTTSYVGIQQALGLNVAEEVLRLIQFELRPPPITMNQTVTITL
jgi:predicted ATP-grasp superfamily ATP-dependent carboligase